MFSTCFMRFASRSAALSSLESLFLVIVEVEWRDMMTVNQQEEFCLAYSKVRKKSTSDDQFAMWVHMLKLVKLDQMFNYQPKPAKLQAAVFKLLIGFSIVLNKLRNGSRSECYPVLLVEFVALKRYKLYPYTMLPFKLFEFG